MQGHSDEEKSVENHISKNVRYYYFIIIILLFFIIMIPRFYPFPAVPIFFGAGILLCALESWAQTKEETPTLEEQIRVKSGRITSREKESKKKKMPSVTIVRKTPVEIANEAKKALKSIQSEIDQWIATVQEFKEKKIDLYQFLSSFLELSKNADWSMQHVIDLLWKEESESYNWDEMDYEERSKTRERLQKKLFGKIGILDIVKTLKTLASSQTPKDSKLALEILTSNFPFWVEPWPALDENRIDPYDHIGFQIQEAITESLTKPYVSGTYSALLTFIESTQIIIDDNSFSTNSSSFSNTSLEAFKNAAQIVAQSSKHKKRLLNHLKSYLPNLNRRSAWGVFFPVLELIVGIEGTAAIPTLLDCFVEDRWEEDHDRNSIVIRMIGELDPSQLPEDKFYYDEYHQRPFSVHYDHMRSIKQGNKELIKKEYEEYLERPYFPESIGNFEVLIESFGKKGSKRYIFAGLAAFYGLDDYSKILDIIGELSKKQLIDALQSQKELVIGGAVHYLTYKDINPDSDLMTVLKNVAGKETRVNEYLLMDSIGKLQQAFETLDPDDSRRELLHDVEWEIIRIGENIWDSWNLVKDNAMEKSCSMALAYFEKTGQLTGEMKEKFDELIGNPELSIEDFFSKYLKIVTE